MPAYLERIARGELGARIAAALALMEHCTLCPRECGVNRLQGELGVCQTGRLARVASFHPHFGEEAPLVGEGGSGTIFFAGCSLGCVFCQNWDISHEVADSPEVSAAGLAGTMLRLQAQGVANINLVTPSHVVPQILEALPLAAEQGLRLPLVYNSSGYDSVATLRLLDGVVDIYMPDAKFWDPEPAIRFCKAPDYPERARAALREMHRQVGDLELDAQGLARRGLLVRHLVMPDQLGGSAAWLEFLARELSPRTYVNIMDQYRPCGGAHQYPELNRGLRQEEYQAAVTAAQAVGLERIDGLERRMSRFLWRLLQQD